VQFYPLQIASRFVILCSGSASRVLPLPGFFGFTLNESPLIVPIVGLPVSPFIPFGDELHTIADVTAKRIE
jgi:hypothetical protein